MPVLTQKITKEITWDGLAFCCENGQARQYLSIGDTVSAALKNGEGFRIAVAGINIYKDNEVVFAFTDILSKEARMNIGHTNGGGYEASAMAEYLDTEIFSLLPDGLQAAIKARRGHKLWLFSRREVFGNAGEYICPMDDVHIPYYQNAHNRIKTRNNSPDWWWLGSPYAAGTADFCVVSSTGNSACRCAAYFDGVAPGFCI